MNRALSMSLSIIPRNIVRDQTQPSQQDTPQGQIMNRKVQKHLKKIEKNEEKELKILQNQRKQLSKALQETEKYLEARQKKLDKTTSDEEQRINEEIEKLTKRLSHLQGEKVRLANERESVLQPLRQQCSDFKEKLKMVDRQLDDVDSRHHGQFRRLSSTDSQMVSNDFINQSINQSNDFSPSSPPPYEA